MEGHIEHTYSVRNCEDGQTVTFFGDGEFCIGLTLDESIACVKQTAGGSAPQSQDDNDIVVPLVMLTVWRTSGVTVCPASRDLKCKLNGEDISTEANIIPGNKVEVGDKVLELVEGSAPKPGRRHLPPTPGVPILPTPPPKPQRTAAKTVALSEAASKESASRDALREWCLIELPNSENELLQQIKDPEQLASLASSYLTRHINQHTDVVMSTELTDRIFKVMQEVAHHRRDILRRFLCEVISEVVEEKEEDVPADAASHHATVTALLVEILRQFLDPAFLVLMCLQLLRALSHIPGNVMTMVASQTTAAVLGSMAVYKDDETVQNNCLDILAKMATFMPSVLEKPPMRESSIDLVAMAMKLHTNNLTVIQAGIRTLANLAATLHSLAFASMIDSPYPDLRTYISLVMSVLEYLYHNTLALVRDALAVYCADLTVKMDGRRFLFECAKMDQLRRQCKIWESQPDMERPVVNFHDEVEDDDASTSICNGAEDADSKDTDGEHGGSLEKDSLYEDENGGSNGILKKARSFENLKTPDRRVSFIDENDLQGHDSFTSSSSEAYSPTPGQLPDPHPPDNSNGVESPDIQILSRSLIYPANFSSVDSSDGEIIQPVNTSSSALDNSVPPAKPARRPIGAIPVCINTPSDSEPEPGFHSPDETNGNVSNESCSDGHDGRHSEVKNVNQNSSSVCGSFDSSSPGSLSGSSQSPCVDLTDFRYSAADENFMRRLMSIQVTCHLCSASVRGRDPQALRLIDLPLFELLARPGIPPGVLQFARSQYKEETTLMDTDPATVISVIDAVRYKMLAFDLVRKSLEVLVQSLTSKLHVKMFFLVGEVLASVVRDTQLSPIAADEEYVSGLEKELVSVTSALSEPCASAAVAVRETFCSMVKGRMRTGQI
ncbi:uncharacterized protein LOC101851290 [Aplysia californica]|uniref:Uncharacterized protein LOC101851290 n=1 Tax=Aplysia californica TaxID=6500 RepID=A0ABM0K1B5_APLCA|nr:uncharacterized protein LOC101851290 [Aplysia californica]